jgi:hypothetical protein
VTTVLREQFREIPGFVVFDAVEAQAEVDRRAGALVRFTRHGTLELNGPSVELLADRPGARTISQGVMLCFAGEARRVGVVPAPTWCPPGKRMALDRLGSVAPRTRRTADWPAAVDARLFIRVYGLRPQDVRGEPRPADLVDGVLVFSLGAVGATA